MDQGLDSCVPLSTQILTNGGGQLQNPENKKLAQQQLVLLLHARICQQKEKSEPQNYGQCKLPYCYVMKGVLEHMTKCISDDDQCKFAHCLTSRQVIIHWKNCDDEYCQICIPVKKYTNNQNVSFEIKFITNDIKVGRGVLMELVMETSTPQLTTQPKPTLITSLTPQLTNTGQTQDPEKIKLIQQQLVLLLHAHSCQKRDVEIKNRVPCNLPYCNVMKGVLEHLVKCTSGRQCNFAHCYSSRQIITHWKNCNKEDCTICNKVKKYTNQGGAADPKRGGDTNNMEIDQNVQSEVVPGLNISVPVQAPTPVMTSSVNLSQPPMDNSKPIQYIKDNLMDHNTNSQPNDGIPFPEPPTQVRDWHASITLNLRNHLVGKLIRAIFPSPDPAAIHDQRIRDLISYARKVEKDMFEQAPDKEAYYHMLAEKIYKMQKELQEKKKCRLDEKQQQLNSSI